MDIAKKIAFNATMYVLAVVIVATLGWFVLDDDFHLGWYTWNGIATFGIGVIQAERFLEDVLKS